MKLSTSKKYQKKQQPAGYTEQDLSTIEQYIEALKFDWSPLVFREGYRKGSNFKETYCLFADVDNDPYSNQPICTIDQFKEIFKDVKYLLCTSRNHQKDKFSNKGKVPISPADRFHVLFPLQNPLYDKKELKLLLRKLIQRYPFFDPAVNHAGVAFFGNKDVIVHYNKVDTLIDTKALKEFNAFQTAYEQTNQEYSDPDFAPEDTQTIEIEFSDNQKQEIVAALIVAGNKNEFDSYEDWLRVGMLLKKYGFDLEDWKKISYEDTTVDFEYKWQSFPDNPLEITQNSLLYFARKGDPNCLINDVPAVRKKDSLAFSKQMDTAAWHYPHIYFTDNGKFVIKKTLENFKAMLDFYGIAVRENLLTHKVEASIHGRLRTEGKEENFIQGIIESLCMLNEFDCIGRIDTYLAALAHDNAYHPVDDWLKSLDPWDGISRIQNLSDTIELKLPEESDSASINQKLLQDRNNFKTVLLKKWLISAVAAIREPDFKSRLVLTLQGKQNQGKTRWFERLVYNPSWFKDGLILDPKNKDSVEVAISHWVCELGELEGTFRKADIAQLKAFISSNKDIIRLPYERRAETYARRTILCATVNEASFLTDPTGSTRFGVLAVKRINHEHTVDIPQLWAEILVLYNQGEQWWLTESEMEISEAQNKGHTEISEIEELIEYAYDWEYTGKECRKLYATQVAIEIGYMQPKRNIVNMIFKLLKEKKIQRVYSKGYTLFIVPPLAGNFHHDF